MKKFWFLAVALLLVSACGGKDNPDTPTPVTPAAGDITGIWELSSVTTKATVGSVNVSVYVEFISGGTFTLYQKIGEGRYTKFNGKFSFQDGSLSGSYSDGTKWGPYTASLSGETLTLTSAGGKETDTYKKVSAIPESVLSNVY